MVSLHQVTIENVSFVGATVILGETGNLETKNIYCKPAVPYQYLHGPYVLHVTNTILNSQFSRIRRVLSNILDCKLELKRFVNFFCTKRI